MRARDRQEGGNHYHKSDVQLVDYLIPNNIPFCEGSVMKYVARHREKNGKEDLLKAIHYIEMIMEAEYPNERTKTADEAYPADTR